MFNPGLNFAASKNAPVSDECVFDRTSASRAFCSISQKHTFIYSAFLKSAKNASEKKLHNGLVVLILYINMELYK